MKGGQHLPKMVPSVQLDNRFATNDHDAFACDDKIHAFPDAACRNDLRVGRIGCGPHALAQVEHCGPVDVPENAHFLCHVTECASFQRERVLSCKHLNLKQNLRVTRT